jgi:hypothetical protein
MNKVIGRQISSDRLHGGMIASHDDRILGPPPCDVRPDPSRDHGRELPFPPALYRVRVIQRRQQLRFPLEACHLLRVVGEGGGQHLDATSRLSLVSVAR